MTGAHKGNTTEARLLLAKKGDPKAFEELLLAYSPLIESMVSAFLCNDSESDESDDLRQEASIAFYSAIEHFDNTQEISFGSFAKICIRNRLISYSRKKRQQPHTVSLECGEVESDASDPVQTLVEEENYLSLTRRIVSLLSPYENRIWWLYLSGRGAKEIANVVGKDEKSVQNAIYRIRKKLRSSLPGSMPE